jgi:hypothetical protein
VKGRDGYNYTADRNGVVNARYRPPTSHVAIGTQARTFMGGPAEKPAHPHWVRVLGVKLARLGERLNA